ncbi:MAG: hypothetical protein QOD10_6024, partial [Mycobacterium sp.]|nr:hypothetical protein [Mycobacterium sp.]
IAGPATDTSSADLRDRQPIADHRQHGREAACRICWLTHLFASTAPYGGSTSDRRGEYLNNGCRVCTNSPDQAFYHGVSKTKCPTSAEVIQITLDSAACKNQGYLPNWHENRGQAIWTTACSKY